MGIRTHRQSKQNLTSRLMQKLRALRKDSELEQDSFITPEPKLDGVAIYEQELLEEEERFNRSQMSPWQQRLERLGIRTRLGSNE